MTDLTIKRIQGETNYISLRKETTEEKRKERKRKEEIVTEEIKKMRLCVYINVCARVK